MSSRALILFAILLLVCLDMPDAKRLTLPFASTNKRGRAQKVLSVRGGGLGLEARTAGKIFTGLWLGQGAAFSLAPKAMLSVYGMDRESELSEFIVENMGGATVTTGVAAFCMQFQEMPLSRAIGWSGVSWTLHHLYWYLSGSYQRVGFKMPNALFTTLTSLMLLYVGFADPTWASTYMKISIAVYSLVATQGIFAPEASLAFWSRNQEVADRKLKFAFKAFMYHLLGHEIHALCLVQGVEPHRAIAFASCSVLIFFLDSFFLSKEIPTLIEKSTGYGFWVCLFPYLIGAILGEEVDNKSPGAEGL